MNMESSGSSSTASSKRNSEGLPLPQVSTSVSHRSPNFSKEELTALLDLVESNKIFVLNKNVNGIVNRGKDAAWVRIAKEINSLGFENERTPEVLRTKWQNLRHNAKKLRGKSSDYITAECDDVMIRVVGLMHEDINTINVPEIEFDTNESSEIVPHTKIRSSNFNPEECKLLIKCVRTEKSILFDKGCSLNSLKQKQVAWERVTELFNKESQTVRTSKVLKLKFENMRRATRSASSIDIGYFNVFKKKHKRLVEAKQENMKNIKPEPVFHDEASDDGFDDLHNGSEGASPDHSADPLSSTLNGAAANGTTSNHTAISNNSVNHQVENSESEKLKLELLNYQLETAKLDRQRVLNQIQAESSERESRAVETALRLRTARLAAVAAQGKLPHGHPALCYTPEEARAERYMHASHF